MSFSGREVSERYCTEIKEVPIMLACPAGITYHSKGKEVVFMKVEKIENMCGGKGCTIIKHILGEKELNGKCGLYAEVTIPSDCSLGYHEHHGESETYFILSGRGEYDDNGTIRPVKPGDVTFTPSGSGHALVNTGDTDLVFMALIIFD